MITTRATPAPAANRWRTTLRAWLAAVACEPARRTVIEAPRLDVILRENFPLRLSDARGRRILCTSGCVWITAPGLFEDIFLHKGDAWEVPGNDMVLIEAVGGATAALQLPGQLPHRARVISFHGIISRSWSWPVAGAVRTKSTTSAPR